MAFLLTTMAGMSTLIGALIILFIKNKKDKILISSLAFAAGVMTAVSFTDLIPETIKLFNIEYNNVLSILFLLIFINIGVILSMLIDYFLPNIENKIYRVGIVSMLAIILHNIPEGIATYLTSNIDISLGITLTLAIAAHNIPEGITIAVPIYYATNSKKKAFLYTFISGLSELFGAIIAVLFLEPIMTNTRLGFIYAIIAGIMLHISFYELIPTALKSKNYSRILLFYLIGWGVILINHFLIV